VQRRRAIQKKPETFRHFFENIPNFFRLRSIIFFALTNGMNVTEFFQTADDERLEPKRAPSFLADRTGSIQFRSDHDHGTAE